jgi:hypothetical protein
MEPGRTDYCTLWGMGEKIAVEDGDWERKLLWQIGKDNTGKNGDKRIVRITTETC